jgi:GR25 family glycosyltransferase involved in LPS biosynthesis
MQSFPIFVINLDRSSERWAFMSQQAERVGLPVNRFSAVDGSENVPKWMADQFRHSPLSTGEIGLNRSGFVGGSRS